MNEDEARFMRVKRFSEEDLSALHDVERVADSRWSEFRDDNKKRGDGWIIAGAQKMVEIERGLPAFWNPRQPDPDRARTVDVFLHSPSVRRAFVALKDADKTDVEGMHAADWLVWKLAPAVGTVLGDSVRSNGAEHGR